MAAKKDTKETKDAKAAHSSSSRIEEQADGTVGAFLTIDGEETWIGAFADERTAQFDIQNQLDSVQARWDAEEAAAAAETE